MLIRLTIKNYALIRHLEMEPSAGLTVITGETGAGKSIILGAVGLLLGNRVDTKVILNDTEKCVTEGVFDITSYSLRELLEAENLDYESQTVIRREITAAGKSRAFINDTPVSLETLRKIGSKLMDVHSQHETLELGSRSFQLLLIDTFAANQKIKDEYSLTWKEFVRLKKDYESLVAESDSLRKDADFVKFQLNELVQANLQAQELEDLESQLAIVEHAEDIKSRFNDVIGRISGSDLSVRSWLAEVRSKLQATASYAPAYAQLLQRVESLRIELDDILQEIEQEESKIEFDPDHAGKLNERLSTINQLLQKHRCRNVAELIALRESFQEKADKTFNLDETLAAARVKLEAITNTLNQKSLDLSKSREKTVAPLCREITEKLIKLGIPNAQLKIDIEKITPGPSGGDGVEVLFSANKGVLPRPLAQVASGGEFSRVMFSVKYVMAEKTSMPTLILDEIDNGVSGEVAIQLGKMMKAMAGRHQLIAITHLPQIAAKGDSHYFVYKDNSSEKTVSHIRPLEGQERVAEIAKMIGGAKPSALALENARELIER
jgi:DNA repair protein RecN (Recombination protein N)